MPSYRVHIDIAAPAADVFTRVADLERHPEWSNDPLQVSATGPDQFASTAKSKGKTITATIRVIEREAPKVFAFEVEDLTGRWINRFTLTPQPSGTRVEREVSGELGGAQLLLFWLVLLPIKKPNARRSLETLKGLVEGNAG